MENQPLIEYSLKNRIGDNGTFHIVLRKDDDVREYDQDVCGLNKVTDMDAFMANYANDYYHGVFGVYAFEPAPEPVAQPSVISRILSVFTGK